MSDPTERLKWETTWAGNEVLHGGEFYISFNGHAEGGIENPMLVMANTLGSILGGLETKHQETALKGPDGVWRILNGDYRKHYEAAFPKGFAACLEVYKQHRADNRSDWSTDDD